MKFQRSIEDLKSFGQVGEGREKYEAGHIQKIIRNNDIVFFNRNNKSQWNNVFRL